MVTGNYVQTVKFSERNLIMLGMSRQEMFDKVCQHLKTQKKRSMLSNYGLCAYRDHDGLKCAVGALIPDDFYDVYMNVVHNTSSVINLMRNIPELKIEEVNLDFLDELQRIHDNRIYWDENGFNGKGILELKRFAKEFNLTYSD